MSEIKEPKVSYDDSLQSAEEKELPVKGNDRSSPNLKTSTHNRMSQDTNEAEKELNLLTKGNDTEVSNATLPKTSGLSSELLDQESIRNPSSEVIPGATTAIIDPETVVTCVSDDVPMNSLSDSSRTVSLTNENVSTTPPSAQVVDSVINTMVVNTISSETDDTPTTTMVGQQMTVLDTTESAASGTSIVLSQIPSDAGGRTAETKPSKVTTVDKVTASPTDNTENTSNDNTNINNTSTTAAISTTNNNTTTTTAAITTNPTTATDNNTNDQASSDGTVASSAIPNHGGSSDGSSPTARTSSPATGAAATITSSTTASPSGTPPLNNSGSSCGVGNANNASSGGTHSPPNPQHVVLVHIQLGEIFAVRVGDQVQHIRGKDTITKSNVFCLFLFYPLKRGIFFFLL